MTEAEERTDEEESLDLVAAVTAYDEELGGAVADLEERVEDLEATLAEREATLEERETALEAKTEAVEELTDRLKRTQADFQNYKKRAKRRQAEVEARATEGLVERLLDVRDDLNRALEEDDADLESLREGVRMTRNEFDRILDAEDVTRIEPDPGEDVDPASHEVLMRVASEQPADTVAEVYRPGYEMGGKVLRAAQVTVSDGPAEGGAGGDDATDESDDTEE